jgi:hypothetical protein
MGVTRRMQGMLRSVIPPQKSFLAMPIIAASHTRAYPWPGFHCPCGEQHGRGPTAGLRDAAMCRVQAVVHLASVPERSMMMKVLDKLVPQDGLGTL